MGPDWSGLQGHTQEHGPWREAVRSSEDVRQHFTLLSVLHLVSVSPERTETERTGNLIPHSFHVPPQSQTPSLHPAQPPGEGALLCSARAPHPGPTSPSATEAIGPSMCLPCCVHTRVRHVAGTEPSASQPLIAPSPQPRRLHEPPGRLHGWRTAVGEASIRSPSSTRCYGSNSIKFHTGPLPHRALSLIAKQTPAMCQSSSASHDCNTDPQVPFPRLQPQAN